MGQENIRGSDAIAAGDYVLSAIAAPVSASTISRGGLSTSTPSIAAQADLQIGHYRDQE